MYPQKTDCGMYYCYLDRALSQKHRDYLRLKNALNYAMLKSQHIYAKEQKVWS